MYTVSEEPAEQELQELHSHLLMDWIGKSEKYREINW